MKYIFIGLILFFVVGGIHAQQGNQRQPTKDTVVFKGVSDAACAVEIDFGSYGAGIDGKAYDEVMSLIGRRKLSHSSRNMGREGEQRICLTLTELKACKRKAFIKEVKKIARRSQLVSLSVR
jgi:hypothetical protein